MAQPNVINFPERSSQCAECSKASRCVGFDLMVGDTAASLGFNARPRLLHKQETLINDGDPFESLFAVRSGTLKIYKTTETGEEQIIDFRLPGDLIGLEAFYDGRFNCHAIALDTASVCMLDYSEIERCCETSAAFRKAFLRRMSGAIMRTENFVVTLGTRDAYQRLAAFLVTLTEYYGDRGYSRFEFVLPMSRADIADYLNLAVETVSRLFSRLQAAECVQVNRSAVKVMDLNRLYDAAGMALPSTQRQSGIASNARLKHA